MSSNVGKPELTVFLGARGQVGGCRCQHHLASFVSHLNEEIMDILEVHIDHRGVLQKPVISTGWGL